MRWSLILLGLGGCSLLLGEDTNADRDAAVAPVDASSPLDASPDAPVNTDNHTLPYTCDDDTIALYKFDLTGANKEECGDWDTISGGSGSVVHDDQFAEGFLIGSVNDVRLTATRPFQLQDELTIEAWVLPPALPASEQRFWIVSSADPDFLNGSRRFGFGLVGNVAEFRLRAEAYDEACATSNFVEASTALQTGTWAHVATTVDRDMFDNLTITLFVNGAQQGQSAVTNNSPGLCRMGTNDSLLMVGGLGATDNILGSFGHAVDELRISSSVRF